MLIKSLKLISFRSFKKAEFNFDRVTQIVGDNGTGKTNILEAIRLLSVLKSFRAKIENEMINYIGDYLSVIGEVETVENNHKEVSVYLDKKQKIAKINKTKHRFSEFIGFIPTVLFSSSDLEIVSGPPNFRRRFIDSAICQYNHVYLRDLLELKAILKQRNSLLEQIKNNLRDTSTLEIWNNKLIEINAKIYFERERFFESISSILKSLDSSITITPILAQLTLEMLDKALRNDLRYLSTTIGPHHDDFKILLDKKDASIYGSRGEQKTAIIILKIAEKRTLEKHLKGETAILLLDDIFSELDAQNQKKILDLSDDGQVILTSIGKQKVGGKSKCLLL